MDAQKVEKHFCAVMGGNGMFYHVKHVSPKMSENLIFGFAEKVFGFIDNYWASNVPKTKPIRYTCI
jgi:hypothetical protein